MGVFPEQQKNSEQRESVCSRERERAAAAAAKRRRRRRRKKHPRIALRSHTWQQDMRAVDNPTFST
jgi:hypothetical protein